MNAENFAYWMNGAIELGRQKSFDNDQVKIIQDHLGLVIKKVTPMYQLTQGPGLSFGSGPPALTC